MNPEWWHADDGDSAEIEVTELVAAFVNALKPEVVVETGTAFGQTAEAIGWALLTNDRGDLWTLETDKERAIFAEKRCRGLPVLVIRESSLEWLPHAPIEFAWFDSFTHLRVAEFRHFYPHFARHAVVGFHDTSELHQPLRREIEVLASEGKLRPIFLRTPRGVAFCEVL